MSSDENKKVVEYLYAESAKGNNEPMFNAFAETIVWTNIGSTLGRSRGRRQRTLYTTA